MRKQLYYRFELYQNGQPLDVGIFQGMHRVFNGRWNNNNPRWNLEREFNRILPAPPIDTIKKEKKADTRSYFTKEGLVRFLEELNLIEYLVRYAGRGFEVRRKIIALSPIDERIGYVDDFQIVLLTEKESA